MLLQISKSLGWAGCAAIPLVPAVLFAAQTLDIIAETVGLIKCIYLGNPRENSCSSFTKTTLKKVNTQIPESMKGPVTDDCIRLISCLGIGMASAYVAGTFGKFSYMSLKNSKNCLFKP